MKKLSVFILICVSLASCANFPQKPKIIFGDNYAYTRDYITSMIKQQMDDNNIVGLSIALVDDQKIVWAQGFGEADVKNKIKATEQTTYRAGSISKLFTAIAIMQLQEQGKLSVDHPLKKYLPQFAMQSRFPAGEPITIKSIMTHHSGLPSGYINSMWGDDSAKFTDLVGLLKDEYVSFPVNTIHSYSNVGFSLLGHVVENVSGQKFEDYIKQHILQPANMGQAYIAYKPNDIDASKGFLGGKETSLPHNRDIPSGGLSASVTDMAHFAQMIFAQGKGAVGQVLNSATLASMIEFQDGSSTFDLHPSMGLTWMLDDKLGSEAGLIVGHSGNTAMFNSAFQMLPKHKLGVVVFANSSTSAGAVEEIAKVALRLALETKTGVKIKEILTYEQEFPAQEKDLINVPGNWATGLGIIKIKRDDNQLTLEFPGIDSELDLVRQEDGYYHLKYKFLGFIPAIVTARPMGFKKIAGRDILFHVQNGVPLQVFAEKIQPLTLPENWKRYLGNYKTINSKGITKLKHMTLKYEDNFLQAVVEMESPMLGGTHVIAVAPVAEDKAVILGLGRGTGDTIQFTEENGQIIARYSGYKLVRQ